MAYKNLCVFPHKMELHEDDLVLVDKESAYTVYFIHSRSDEHALIVGFSEIDGVDGVERVGPYNAIGEAMMNVKTGTRFLVITALAAYEAQVDFDNKQRKQIFTFNS